MRLSAAVLAVLAATSPACTVGGSSVPELDGVELPVSREASLAVETWPLGGLELGVLEGDVRVAPGERNAVLVRLHETREGDARLVLRGRRLELETTSGQPAALGGALVTVRDPLPSLAVVTGRGDLRVDLAEVERALTLRTGQGDVVIAAGRAGDRTALETGTGRISVTAFEGTVLRARTERGDVELREVQLRRVELVAGTGHLVLLRSRIEHVTARTGLGDIELVDCLVEETDLETGLGDVRR